jgi:predicted RNA binding protein YcfA (HicA-like mRNA interferase family)
MSGKLPRITAREIISILKKKGFSPIKGGGHPKVFKNAQGVRIPVPYHPGKILRPKTLKSILKQADIDVNSIKKR